MQHYTLIEGFQVNQRLINKGKEMSFKVLNSKWYITKGIQYTLDPLLQFYLWTMLNERISKIEEVDYLQVFDINPVSKDSQILQQIKYTQEIPQYSKTVLLHLPNPIQNKVFIIQSQHKTREEYWTMMLAEEY